MNYPLPITEKRVIRVNPPVHDRVFALADVFSKEEGQNITAGKVIEKAIDLLEKKVSLKKEGV